MPITMAMADEWAPLVPTQMQHGDPSFMHAQSQGEYARAGFSWGVQWWSVECEFGVLLERTPEIRVELVETSFWVKVYSIQYGV